MQRAVPRNQCETRHLPFWASFPNSNLKTGTAPPQTNPGLLCCHAGSMTAHVLERLHINGRWLYDSDLCSHSQPKLSDPSSSIGALRQPIKSVVPEATLPQAALPPQEMVAHCGPPTLASREFALRVRKLESRRACGLTSTSHIPRASPRECSTLKVASLANPATISNGCNVF